eukprot:scaffold1797_cov453-Pavlova_lutheri.AAC.1
MTGNQDFLDTTTLRTHTGHIEIADGSLLEAKAIGTVKLTLKDDHQTKIELQNVVYVPGLSANLISVTCMTDNGASVRFNKGTCLITQGDKTIKANLTESANYCFAATASIWHQRLGHIHSSRIKKLGLPYKLSENCNACAENKQTATKFKPKDYQYEPLDLVYMDVVGPIHPETPGGHRYYMSALDHATKTCLVYLMQSKGHTGKYARRAINVLEQKAEGKKHVRAIRTDLGQEFLGKQLADFLSERGIEHEKTAGYAPQQNDAERLHRDIREHASTMLNASNLPQKYWGEAVRTYAYTRNKLPPTHGAEIKSPLEKLTGRKQSVSHLRTFGCEAWVLKPKEKWTSKFEPRSEKGIFIGYENSTTYRVLLSNRLVTSRNVRFNEEQMGQYNRSTENEQTMYLEDSIETPNQWELSSKSSDEEQEEEEPEPAEEENSQRYNLRPNRQTNFKAYLTEGLPDKFDGYHKAMKRPDKDLWSEAIHNELESLSKMRTWDICDLPAGKKPLGSKWIFRVKRDEMNNITKYKARLVALGCHQKPGEDYDEIYAAVVSKTGLRIFLTAVNHLDLEMHQMDIETAFLNADLEDEVYLKIPDGLNKRTENQALKLNKSLYGLKQAPRVWNQELTKTLKKMNFECIRVDENMLKCRTDQGTCYLCFYVDDILLASKNTTLINQIKDLIRQHYKATDLGEAKNFLGITISRDRNNRVMSMEQAVKVKEYLEQHRVTECKPNTRPLSVPVSSEEKGEIVAQTTYQKIVGQLQYLGGTTRPDLTHAASVLARYNTCPTSIHWNAMRGTLKYLKGTEDLQLIYTGTTEDENQAIQITAYSDADYASDKDNRRSRTGFAIQVLGGLVSWQSKLQPTIATSTTEAEYQAASAAIKESLWIRNLVQQLLNPKQVKVTILIDNQSTLRLLKNPQSVTRAKHIDVQHHFMRERAMRNEVEMNYCETEKMWADYLTKQVPTAKFKLCIQQLGMTWTNTELSGSVGRNTPSSKTQP